MDNAKRLTGTEISAKPADERQVTIGFRNGTVMTYAPDEYTDYQYMGRVFVVINGLQWVGIFNMETVEYITVM